jgi:trigger factor
MSVKVEKLERNTVKLEITVPAEKFQEGLKKSYNKNKVNFNIPGFRKGKAPMPVIEKYYGEGVFYEDAINFVCDDTYPKAIEENNIEPVDYPEIDIVQMGKNIEFVYTAIVTVKPEVTLGQYKDIEAKKVEYAVSEEEIENQLKAMREKNSRVINKEEGSVENGDIAVIDFEGFLDGVAFEGGKGENHNLTIGSGTFIPGFEEQLVGVKLGDSVEINVTFPEDYHAEELKGKEVTFKVKVNEIRYKEIPELDDEFVKEVSEFDTVEELKNDLTRKQEESNKARAKKDYEDEVIKKVVEGVELEIPEAMVNREIDFMVKDLDARLRYQGLTVDKYMELMGITMDSIRKDFNDIAANRVKTNLVLEAIAKTENIGITDEEMAERAEELAKSYGVKDVEKIKEAILKSEKSIIEEELVNNKVIENLVKWSKVVE